MLQKYYFPRAHACTCFRKYRESEGCLRVLSLATLKSKKYCISYLTWLVVVLVRCAARPFQ